MTDRKRPAIALLLMPLFAGLIAWFSVMQSPRFEQLHFLDIVRLLTAGFGFGTTFAGFIFFLVRPR